MRLRLTQSCALVLALAGCNAFSEAPPDSEGSEPGRPGFGGSAVGSVGPTQDFGGGVAGVGGPVGTQFGEVVVSSVPPVPIQGGTLLVMKDGHTAIAADPDRDRVMIADLNDGEVLATLDLRPGDEPGRLVEDANGRVHIVLRHAGVIATLDVAARALVDRRDVCLEPQGIAYSKATDALLVACTEGDLVELPAGGGARSRVAHVDSDLRDVNIVGERVLVSRFKSAELLELDAAFQLVGREHATEITGPFGSNFPMAEPSDLGSGKPKSFAANVAFRTLSNESGQVVMLHQRAQSTEIQLDDGAVDEGAGSEGPFPGQEGGGDPYGGGDMCSAIVRPALSVEGNGSLRSGPVLPAATLAVDAAFSPNGRWLAVGVAGSPDVSQKTFGMLTQLSALVMSTESVMATDTPEGEVGNCPVPGIDGEGAMLSVGQVVAVAFDSQNRLVMQTREPSALHIMANFEGCVGASNFNTGGSCTADTTIDFGGESRADTGQLIFHSDAGAGLACASCHPGGAEDGHTWMFSTIGARRTQLFNMGITNTLPLHWDGELRTFNDLVSEVFVRRMGGADLTPSQVSAMESWIGTLEPGTPLRLSTDPAVERGKALFESDAVACASCHVGPMFTNNQTVDVGTGGALQVPSLIGVAHHAPWIHTGCAQTLRDRFNPECGGAKHGNTADLDDGQIDDLVAYLESL